LEWKSQWDLASAETRFETARHILGFGNRGLTLAGRDFEGCAYFLAGIEPGNLIGTSVVDPAELDDQLSRYILPGAPRWTPHYVSIDSKDVLILVIEAPQPGDPICTLQKGFNQINAGRIFIRRHGKTEEAQPADIRALEARMTSSRPKIELAVTAVEPAVVLRSIRLSKENREKWLEKERARLRAPRRQPSAIVLPEIMEDIRGRRGFQDEVDNYLATAPNRWLAEVIERSIGEGVARVELQIENPTERNFAGVEVVAEIQKEDARAWLDRDEVRDALEAPDPPKPWGLQSYADLVNIPAPISVREDEVDRENALKVRFGPKHLRPGETLKLTPFYLTLFGSQEQDELSIHWRITSTGVDGWQEGDIAFSLGEEPAIVVA
jgi:hypothetical protein